MEFIKETISLLKKYYISIGLTLTMVFLLVSFVAPIIFTQPAITNNLDFTNKGAIGDTIGGLMNPFIAISASILTFMAFYIQYKANREVQQQFKIQQFESQFYEMLRLHKENINEMKISGYDYKMSISFNKKTSEEIITRNQVERFVEGRKVFVSMAKELIACYEICKSCDTTDKYKTQDLLELSYKIFFFGSHSSNISTDKIDLDFIKLIKTELKNVRDKHKETVGGVSEFESNTSDKNIKLHIKYIPFTGHENRLGHYYRHLYSTVKYVVNKEKEGLIDYKQSREYLKILRSQMSNDEQLMLYYNYIIGFGRDWQKEGYLTKYRMLHNLPINKVKYVEKPREHFQEFIKSIEKGESSLFEWDDIEYKKSVQ